MAPASAIDTSPNADPQPRRVALVTGASRGIGFEIARRLADEGYDLTISARRREGLIEAADKLRASANIDVHPVVANLAAGADTAELVNKHADHYGALDLLVLNAGVGALGQVAELSTKQYDLVLNVNLRSQFVLIQQALPLLKKAAAAHPDSGARIVALASITGVAAEPGLSAYGASKAALISLCETLSLEESENGVSATAISPGFVATDMTSGMHDTVDAASMLQATDVAELVVALSRLSARAVVPNIVISRAGSAIWRA
jgi:3-oxoacyl-[acyl-carrier protein] reductase